MGKGSYKTVQEKVRLGDAFDATEINSLAEEMRDWADRLSGTPAENTMKAQTVGESADTLESAAEELESLCGEVGNVLEAHGLNELELSVAQSVLRTKRRYGPSRATRLSNALVQLGTAVERVRDFVDPDRHFESSLTDDEKATLREHLDEIENHVGDLEAVEFPGMYG